MPAMYAHDTFGRKVATKLPLSVKQPILQYPQMFRVGLQGPDVLFFTIRLRNIRSATWEDPCIKKQRDPFWKMLGKFGKPVGKRFRSFLI